MSSKSTAPQPAGPSPALRGHLAPLDGLRGIAVLMVMLHHLSKDVSSSRILGWFNGHVVGCGWLGVDLFFVLSGFLITRILLSAKCGDHYFRNFYARRTLRIFPLYYLVLFVVFVLLGFAGAFRSPQELLIRHNQGWLWLYGTNIRQALAGKWLFEGGWVHLDHFWSLAVEEHFYLVWPTVVLLLGRRQLVKCIVGILAGALVLRIVCWAAGMSVVGLYVLTPLRMDSLAAGGLLAVLMGHAYWKAVAIRWSRPVLGASFALMVALFIFRGGISGDDPVVVTVGFSVFAAFFVALVAVSLSLPQEHWVRRGLVSRPLRFFGKYSYGLYVYHFLLMPLFAADPLLKLLGRFHGSMLLGYAHMTICIAVATGMAWLSYNLYEKPFLKLKKYFAYEERDGTPATGAQLVREAVAG